ncbi:MAG: hypothetical protein COB25_001835 [Oceanospirillales bacterium]|jgi:hypothetical protein|nr:hypothetical protein [Oceanospirillales bacterium]
MTREEGIDVLGSIVDAAISNAATRNKLHAELAALRAVRGPLPAKGILAEVQKHGDQEISDEVRSLIKDVYFYFA